jgi:soluble lytic murein transglycosylase-like protein
VFAQQDQSYANKEAARAAAISARPATQPPAAGLAPPTDPGAYYQQQRAKLAQFRQDPTVVALEQQREQLLRAGKPVQANAVIDQINQIRQQYMQVPQPAAPIPAPAPAVAPAAAPNKAAQKYDAKVTPYDNLIAQSAQQYGIDPVVFKRLIGTESSFSPTAVSPRGEKFGLGIAQIADVHGLSREQRLDPNTAIPFAAQLFSQYLGQSGGNYEQAIQRYKGAASEKGKAAMAAPVSTILSGLNIPGISAAQAAQPEAVVRKSATQTADAVVAAAKALTPAASGVMYGPAAVDASINNPQIQQVLEQRKALTQQMALMEQYGFGAKAMELLPQVQAIDLGLFKAQADQGIYEGTMTGNFSRAMSVLSHFRGQPHQVLDRGDGTFDLYVGGKVARTGIDKESLADLVRSNVDADYRAQKAELAGARAKQQMKIEEIVAENVIKAQGNLQAALINAQAQIQAAGIKEGATKYTIDPNNNRIVVQEGNRITAVDMQGNKIPIRGKEQVVPSVTQVYGPK